MEAIIPPVERELIKSELTPDKLLRPTNKANNNLYVITAHDSPNIMQEIGRLREISFRSGGGGTGKSFDTDHYDYMKKPYRQLIVWDHENEQIVGGYRFLPGTDVEIDENGQPGFVMSHLFNFSPLFIEKYLDKTIELGRAFVQPDYQTTKMGMKSLFALDNLWDGLGALIHVIPNTRYYIGKVTVYNDFPLESRNLLYNYLNKHFPDPDHLIQPISNVPIDPASFKIAAKLLTATSPTDDYKLLQKELRHSGISVPAMWNAYIGLSDSMRVFGTIFDEDFGSVYETGIMVDMEDLHEHKRARYIQPYLEYARKLLEEKKAMLIKLRTDRLSLKGSRRKK